MKRFIRRVLYRILPEWLQILIWGNFADDDQKCDVCGSQFTWLDRHIYGRIVYVGPFKRLAHTTCYHNSQHKESHNVHS